MLELDSLETSLERVHQHLAQLDRDLRQARADYRRLVDLRVSQAGNERINPISFEVLTHQERRVAALAACGHSNTEVAAQLHVSIHTVKSQMGSILRKLDLRSRWELVHLTRPAEG
jgi:DNA-binding NarL/FixJ family response regulator